MLTIVLVRADILATVANVLILIVVLGRADILCPIYNYYHDYDYYYYWLFLLPLALLLLLLLLPLLLLLLHGSSCRHVVNNFIFQRCKLILFHAR